MQKLDELARNPHNKYEQNQKTVAHREQLRLVWRELEHETRRH